MNTQELFNSLHFILRFSPNKYESIKHHIETKITSFDEVQCLKLAHLLRSPTHYNDEKLDIIRKLLNYVRENIENINSVAGLKIALKIFSQESRVIKRLDDMLLKLGDNLNALEWIDILNTKSILRQRNIGVFEACTMHLMRQNSEIQIDSIQKCLLSCGILNYNESQFFSFLIENLKRELKKNDGDQQWVKGNLKTLESIINSIGMLRLKDEKLLNMLCTYLNKHDQYTSLIINFIISCANVCYEPNNKENLKSLIKKVSLSNFNLANSKEKFLFLNYVWSMCALNFQSIDSDFISTVLNEKFYKSLLSGE
jgi:hypothetical protein